MHPVEMSQAGSFATNFYMERYRKKILLGIDMRFKLLFKDLPMTCDRSILRCHIELLFPFPG